MGTTLKIMLLSSLSLPSMLTLPSNSSCLDPNELLDMFILSMPIFSLNMFGTWSESLPNQLLYIKTLDTCSSINLLYITSRPSVTKGADIWHGINNATYYIEVCGTAAKRIW
jgi:hypothetical protein